MSEQTPLRLLIIDDDAMLRSALQNAFVDCCGWVVVTASDPDEAQQHYAGVDIVMSDWSMPCGGGARVLAESPKPVLVYSSESSIGHPHRLRKPASLPALQHAVLHTLSVARAETA